MMLSRSRTSYSDVFSHPFSPKTVCIAARSGSKYSGFEQRSSMVPLTSSVVVWIAAKERPS